jgi:hypothetical protein
VAAVLDGDAVRVWVAIADVLVRSGSAIDRHATRPVAAAQLVDFDTQIRLILERRCQPCHFAGGKMYARLPFDRPQTIRSLGDKMFTRIKDEQEQALLRSFLAQEPPSPAAK